MGTIQMMRFGTSFRTKNGTSVPFPQVHACADESSLIRTMEVMMITNLDTWTTSDLLNQLLLNRNNMKVVEIENAQIIEILENRIKEIKDTVYKG